MLLDQHDRSVAADHHRVDQPGSRQPLHEEHHRDILHAPHQVLLLLLMALLLYWVSYNNSILYCILYCYIGLVTIVVTYILDTCGANAEQKL